MNVFRKVVNGKKGVKHYDYGQANCTFDETLLKRATKLEKEQGRAIKTSVLFADALQLVLKKIEEGDQNCIDRYLKPLPVKKPATKSLVELVELV